MRAFRVLLVLILVGLLSSFILAVMGRLVKMEGSQRKAIPDSLCMRDHPYDTVPEIKEAIEFISSSFKEKSVSLEDIRNCLNIQYSLIKTGSSDVTSLFIAGKSREDRLEIELDNSYRGKDKLLLAYVLVHEITHARQYLEYKKGRLNKNSTCIDRETEAYLNQLFLLATLNRESIDKVINSVDPGIKDYRAMVGMLNLFDAAASECGDSLDKNYLGVCRTQKFNEKIGTLIKDDPIYQQQCQNN